MSGNKVQNTASHQNEVRRSLSFRRRLGNVISAFIGIAENLIVILTFSSIMPRWTMNWILFRMVKGNRWFWD